MQAMESARLCRLLVVTFPSIPCYFFGPLQLHVRRGLRPQVAAPAQDLADRAAAGVWPLGPTPACLCGGRAALGAPPCFGLFPPPRALLLQRLRSALLLSQRLRPVHLRRACPPLPAPPSNPPSLPHHQVRELLGGLDLPLIWTADFILDTHADGSDAYRCGSNGAGSSLALRLCWLSWLGGSVPAELKGSQQPGRRGSAQRAPPQLQHQQGQAKRMGPACPYAGSGRGRPLAARPQAAPGGVRAGWASSTPRA